MVTKGNQKAITKMVRILEKKGLALVEIEADGSCQFRAFAEQHLGDVSLHPEARKAAVKYISENADDFKFFMDFSQGSSRGRNSARSSRKGAAVDDTFPDESAMDRGFRRYLANMSRPSQYGDQYTLTALAKAYDVDIKVYHLAGNIIDQPAAFDGAQRSAVHMAFHADFDHYSVVRRPDGSHIGPVVAAAASPVAAATSGLCSPPETPRVSSKTPFDSDSEDDCVRVAKRPRARKVVESDSEDEDIKPRVRRPRV